MAHTTFTSIKRRLGILIPFSLLFLFIAGCGSSQQEMIAQDNLRRARTAHKQAMVNPNVEAYAPVPLMDAGKAVQAAERAKNAKEMEHLAYVAEKKSQIAVTIAEGKMAERETERLGKETSEILLQKREQEAKLAKKEAEQAKLLALEKAAEAEKAKLEAETRAREAEQARMEAEAKARETERARMETAAKAREAEQAKLLALAEAARAEKAKAEANQLLRELSNLKAKQTERGIVLTMGDVLFTTGKATISSEANRNIEKLVDFLQKYPNRNVLIEGHTDSVGKDEYNLALSEQRADAVKEQLVAKGIAEERITTKGYGRQYPVASNDSPAGRQQNRRVEVIILNEGVKPETQFRS
jgi:outer membrane protein OmpA-like peptidoglycan-associated protein